MGKIIVGVEGDAPYAPLVVKAISSTATEYGVKVVVSISRPQNGGGDIEIPLLLAPSDILDVAPQMRQHAINVLNWWR